MAQGVSLKSVPSHKQDFYFRFYRANTIPPVDPIYVQRPSVHIVTGSLSKKCFNITAAPASVSLKWFYACSYSTKLYPFVLYLQTQPGPSV